MCCTGFACCALSHHGKVALHLLKPELNTGSQVWLEVQHSHLVAETWQRFALGQHTSCCCACGVLGGAKVAQPYVSLQQVLRVVMASMQMFVVLQHVFRLLSQMEPSGQQLFFLVVGLT